MPAKKKSAASASTAAAKPASSSLWAIVGSDDLKVKEAAQALCRKLVPPENFEFGLEVVEGAADNVDGVERILRTTIEGLQTMPFFGGEKVVWLKGVSFLADTVTGRAEGTLKLLEQLQAVLEPGLPPDVKFILTASDVDKRRSFFLFLKKNANLEVHDAVDTSKSGWEQQVMQMVEGMAEEYGLSFDSGALDLFVMRTGEQSRQIENELEKLDLFLGEERLVTSDHVRQIVAQTRNGIVFELGTAMGKRQLPLALELLDQLLFQGESPVGVLLAAVVPKVRNLFFAQDLAERFGVKASTSRWGYNDYVRDLGALPASATAHLPKNKEGAVSAYPLFFSSQEAGNFTREELFKAMEDVLIANRRLVTTQIDPKLVIGEFLVRMLRPRTTRSRKARPEPARHSGSAK